MQRNEIIRLLKNPKAKAFVLSNWTANPHDLALSKRKGDDFDVKVATQILHLYHKAAQKIPLWSEKMLALDRRSFEQSTPQVVAEFRPQLISGLKLLDLSAGLGVDSTFLSTSFREVLTLESNDKLVEFEKYNDQQLLKTNISRFCDDSIHWKKYCEGVDVLFVDPDRRDEGGKRLYGLEESQPPVLDMLSEFLERVDDVYIKSSPLLDISIAKTYDQRLKALYVIAVDDEVKETLLHYNAEHYGKPEIVSVDLGKTTQLIKNTTLILKLEGMNDNNSKMGKANYLYEPSAAIRKAGIGKKYASSFSMSFINTKSEYYLSHSLTKNWCGRVWEISSKSPVNWSTLKKEFKQRGLSKAHILRKHFPDSAQVIRKRLNLSEGGDTYLVFAKNSQNKAECYQCKRLQ